MSSLKLVSFWLFGQLIPFLSAVNLLKICNVSGSDVASDII